MGGGDGSRVEVRATSQRLVKVVRTFRDGHEQFGWALELDMGDYVLREHGGQW